MQSRTVRKADLKYTARTANGLCTLKKKRDTLQKCVFMHTAKKHSECAMVRELLSANIKKYRKAAGFTQNHFASLCGVSPSFIAHVETNSCGVSVNFIEKVCEILKIEPICLFENQTT